MLNTEQAVDKIYSTNGKVFTAEFIKKDGTLRVMNCRLGVTKHLKGGKLGYDPASKGLIVVFDCQSASYKMINCKTLISLCISGEKFEVMKGIK